MPIVVRHDPPAHVIGYDAFVGGAARGAQAGDQTNLQFDSLNERARQFDVGTEQRADQFAQDLDFRQQQAATQQDQFDANMDFRQDEAVLQRRHDLAVQEGVTDRYELLHKLREDTDLARDERRMEQSLGVLNHQDQLRWKRNEETRQRIMNDPNLSQRERSAALLQVDGITARLNELRTPDKSFKQDFEERSITLPDGRLILDNGKGGYTVSMAPKDGDPQAEARKQYYDAYREAVKIASEQAIVTTPDGDGNETDKFDPDRFQQILRAQDAALRARFLPEEAVAEVEQQQAMQAQQDQAHDMLWGAPKAQRLAVQLGVPAEMIVALVERAAQGDPGAIARLRKYGFDQTELANEQGEY